MTGFVRASELYDVQNGTPLAHPAERTSDATGKREG